MKFLGLLKLQSGSVLVEGTGSATTFFQALSYLEFVIFMEASLFPLSSPATHPGLVWVVAFLDFEEALHNCYVLGYLFAGFLVYSSRPACQRLLGEEMATQAALLRNAVDFGLLSSHAEDLTRWGAEGNPGRQKRGASLRPSFAKVLDGYGGDAPRAALRASSIRIPQSACA